MRRSQHAHRDPRLRLNARRAGRTGSPNSPIGDDAEVASRPHPIPMREWTNKNKPTLFLDGDRMIIAEDRPLAPRTDVPTFDRTRLHALDWTGVDIRVESQDPQRRQDSIQAYMPAQLRNDQSSGVLLEDDRAGEAAGLVGITIRGTELHIALVHCTYSSTANAGARADPYELCGQAMPGATWRQGAIPLLAHLDRRAQAAFARTGVSPMRSEPFSNCSHIRELAPQLRPRCHTILAQSGLPAAAATGDQPRLLADAESYVRALTRGTFDVMCSR